jgi:uncharacterized membrane protein
MRRWLSLSAALAVAAAGLSLYLWLFRTDLPEQLPSHWDIHGQADGTMPKGVALTLLPAMMVGWVGLTLLLPWLSPRRFTVDTFADVYAYCMFLVQAMLLYIHALMTLGSLFGGFDVGRAVVVGVLLLLALLGNVLGKVRRNFWVGVRTPWTLADVRVWERTHRLAAWLFTVAGLLGAVAALFLPPAGLPFCFAGIVLAALLPAVYSLVVYKRLEREGRLGDPSEEEAVTSDSPSP